MRSSRYRAQLGGIARQAGRRLYISASQEQVIVADFRERYLESGVASRWMGEPVSATPLDLWVYQEILYEIRADVVLTVATKNTGYLAALCQMGGRGEVMSPETFGVEKDALVGKTVMVVIGAGVDEDRLADDLALYSPVVTGGSYLIVEDTRHHRARVVEDFLKRNHDFAVDRNREKFYLTLNRGGFLRRR